MQGDQYERFRKEILNKLEGRKFRLSLQEEIATEVTKAVQRTSGGFLNLLPHAGGPLTSKFRTLTAFVEVLNNTSFAVSESTLKRLVKKFQNSNAIREVNLFVERRKNNKKSIGESLFAAGQFLRTPLSNNPKWIEKKAKLRAKAVAVKENVSDFAARAYNSSIRGQFAGMLFTIGAAVGVLSGNPLADFEVMLFIVPLGSLGIDSPTSVQEIEVAHSNKIVKFRAVGSIFLAHQVGGKDSIKIVGKLTGETRFFWLSLLWMLTMISKGHAQTLDFGDTIKNIGLRSPGMFRGIAGTPTALEKIDKTVVQSPSYIKHITFPVILVHEIITNCYIETFSFQETIDGKKDTISYDLLLRTYDEPDDFVGDFQETIFAPKNTSRTAAMVKYSTNFMWRLMKQSKHLALDGDWKIQGYYDVDVVDMALTMGMAIGGSLI